MLLLRHCPWIIGGQLWLLAVIVGLKVAVALMLLLLTGAAGHKELLLLLVEVLLVLLSLH